ncbi:MAG: hypothetical protein JXM68_10565 [Sedimentisphaerales bacterium]|nr:hypothetical protein [Sedimentisphaerales bacterium]
MKKFLWSIILVLCCISLLSAQQMQNSYEQDFEILTQKNIFSRQRFISPAIDDSVSEPNIVQPKAYSSYILIGVSSVNDDWYAFFENLITGDCQIIGVKDEFEGGVVESITADGVNYHRGEDSINLVIGSDMKGLTEIDYVPQMPSGFDAEQGGNQQKDIAAPPTTGGSSVSDVLKKLMQRRNQELK